MKRSHLIAPMLIAVVLIATSAFAQAPPATVLGGAMFKNGGSTHFTAQAGGNINVIQQKNQYGHVTSQAYIQIGGLYSDDIYLTEGEKVELEALTGYAIFERWLGYFAIGTGIGVMDYIKEGENETNMPFLLKCSYRLFEFVDITVQGQYIPIKGEGDLSAIQVGFGITP